MSDRLGDAPSASCSITGLLGALCDTCISGCRGNGAPRARPPARRRDYMRRERPVTRRRPLEGYVSEELARLEVRARDLVWAEEWGALGDLRGALGLMDAPPGTGLFRLGGRGEGEERFERETRTSLFGALQHSRTSDLDVRLDPPQSPATLTSRAWPYGGGGLQPDPGSQSRTCGRPCRPSCHRRCWEGGLVLGGGGLDCQSQLVGDLLNVLIGVASATFPLNQACAQFEVRPGVCISGASPESASRLLGDLAQYGTHYLRLSRFSLQSAQRRGLVFQAFTGGLRRYLQYYRACVLSTHHTLSLLTICFLFRKLGRQLRYLTELCCVDGVSAVNQATFPVGVKLLSYLYNEAQSNCSNENYPVLLSLLKSSCEPYTRFVSDWVYSGVFRDVYGEFMIQVNEDYLGFRDKHFWSQGYTLISHNVEECVPVFLRHIASDVYICGKTINLLKICCPQHYICWSELPVPRIAVTFSLQEVEEIERDCAVYRGRVGMIAKHSAVSREEQAQRAEQARQELISQVRATTAKSLESIRGVQVSRRLTEEAKKRGRFEEQKQQLELVQEWRSAAKRKEQEDEFGFIRELQDREKRLQALEEQLERRARKELLDQYARLTEEATRRERRAVWRVQRLRLDESRARFLREEQRLTQALLERYPLGQPGPPPDPPTPACAPQPTQVHPEKEVQDAPTGPEDTPTGPEDTPTGHKDTPTGPQDTPAGPQDTPTPPETTCRSWTRWTSETSCRSRRARWTHRKWTGRCRTSAPTCWRPPPPASAPPRPRPGLRLQRPLRTPGGPSPQPRWDPAVRPSSPSRTERRRLRRRGMPGAQGPRLAHPRPGPGGSARDGCCSASPPGGGSTAKGLRERRYCRGH
ncbi:hypothetical protein ANANG_G00311050 [Anguilla anguilla]|uniref:Gamma-tubulin complex component n=1 Tax=Anguilla anguilla TaxID=7936 RepID=A0A9D3LLK4_ANGAN|nr:hypothetical protein ANANG_G00311050 [Anguilla anguilla]